jgi:hypothetical protein
MLAADDGDQCQPRESIDAANNLRRTIGAIENKNNSRRIRRLKRNRNG